MIDMAFGFLKTSLAKHTAIASPFPGFESFLLLYLLEAVN